MESSNNAWSLIIVNVTLLNTIHIRFAGMLDPSNKSSIFSINVTKEFGQILVYFLFDFTAFLFSKIRSFHLGTSV